VNVLSALVEFCHRDRVPLCHVLVREGDLVACDSHRLLLVKDQPHEGKPGDLLSTAALLERGDTAVVREPFPYPPVDHLIHPVLTGERRNFRLAVPEWLGTLEGRVSLPATLVDRGADPPCLQLGAEPRFGGLLSLDLRLLRPFAGEVLILSVANERPGEAPFLLSPLLQRLAAPASEPTPAAGVSHAG